MGGILGGGGLISSYLGGREKEQNYRKLRNRLDEERTQALKFLEQYGEQFKDDPLMKSLMSIFQGELEGMPSAESRGGIWDQLASGATGLMDESAALGLGNPQVQDDIISSAIENQLNPAYQEANRAGEARMAGRGLGRSGLAESAARERDYSYAQGSAGIERQVRTEGALQELKDKISKLGAASGVYGLGSQVAGQTAGQAGQFGLGAQGLLGDLAKSLAGVRMQYGNWLTQLGGQPSHHEDTAEGFFNWGKLFNQDPGYGAGAQKFFR